MRYEKCIQEKERSNKEIHDKIKAVQAQTQQFKSKGEMEQHIAQMPQPDEALPPFTKVSNEPFHDPKTGGIFSHFESEQVIEALNSFADTTLQRLSTNGLQLGESLLKKISSTGSELFSGSTGQGAEEQQENQSKNSQNPRQSAQSSALSQSMNLDTKTSQDSYQPLLKPQKETAG